MGIIVGIDGSRNRSGGARAHLIGVLSSLDPREYGIDLIHVWSYKDLLNELPNTKWLIKHNPPDLERNLPFQVAWQTLHLSGELKKAKCDIVLNTDAGSLCRFSPSVVMSRDMLSYEPGIMEKYGFSFARLRLLLLKYIQANSLKNATGAVFLTNYASSVIQKFTGKLERTAIIPHGLSTNFQLNATQTFPKRKTVRCIYVSNVDLYKHQDTVIKAIALLNSNGIDIEVQFAGAEGTGKAQKAFETCINEFPDFSHRFIRTGFVTHKQLPLLLEEADIFLFASSCENMPNTLLEGMASGLPIACSDRGPMPEVLLDGGLYFNPEDYKSIAEAVSQLISDAELREKLKHRSKDLAAQYSWARCAAGTWTFLVHTFDDWSTKRHQT